jgi:23S rRNA pseudouridine1911/1915/1917 synthase
MIDRLSFVAQPDDAGRRLDVAIASRVDRSRTACAEIIKRGLVRVNGRPAKPAHVVDAGERIEVDLPPPTDPSALPESIPVRLVYDDPDLCVVDKPAGIATHPAPGSPRGTLVNALLAALGPLPAINGVRRPGIVHRLDKDTSGLLVVAKSDVAMRGLSRAIAERRVARSYDAIVWGRPPSSDGTIDAPIGRDPAVRTMFAVRADGRKAVTHYRVKERFTVANPEVRRRDVGQWEVSLLELTLETGRTHQIRVHCAAIGHPIVGDALYGASRPKLGARRQMLHAARLRFVHPVSGVELEFESARPEDFAALVERLRAGRAK